MYYGKIIDYINSFINFEQIPTYNYTSSFKLARMHAFLQELGNPQQGLNVIHVAGSKGKGSTCAIIANILKEAGYSVGLYTSPHLLDTRERIRVLTPKIKNQRPKTDSFEGVIKSEEFVELIERIKPAAEKFRDHKDLGDLSFFELLTACAFLYFKERGVDFVVLETGLGGRLDATNVTSPIICGITNISLEHTDKLGNSLDLIAREKAGIIKAQCIVTSALQEKEAMDVIREVCSERQAPLHEIGKDVKYSIVESNNDRQIFNLDGPGYSYKNLELNLIGAHQVENASLAVAIIKSLDLDNIAAKVEENYIRSGLENIFWPGRLQIIREKPYVILDGAQNVASIKAALSSINGLFSYKRLICIFGISSDKDIKGVTRELDKGCDIVILTRSSSSRAKDPSRLKNYFSKTNIELSNDVKGALGMGLNIANRNDLLLVTGSLYVVGEALNFTK